MLEILGLSNDAEAVYRTILAHRHWDLRNIADHLGMTRNDVKAALDVLSSLMLLSADDGLRPVSPQIGLAALLQRAEQDILDRRQQLDTTRAAITAMMTATPAGSMPDGTVRLESIAAVRDRIVELSNGVVRECVSMNPNVTQTSDAKAASAPLNQLMLERGISIRCIYQDSFRNTPQLRSYAQWLTSMGGQLRTAPAVPLLMIVYDRAIALVPLNPMDSAQGALEIRNGSLVALAFALFEQMWNGASSYAPDPEPRMHTELDPMKRKLLQLAADGLTDEQVSRRLGISLTTVRRHMAAVMEELNVRSRFQAGAVAATAGWLDKP